MKGKRDQRKKGKDILKSVRGRREEIVTEANEKGEYWVG